MSSIMQRINSFTEEAEVAIHKKDRNLEEVEDLCNRITNLLAQRSTVIKNISLDPKINSQALRRLGSKLAKLSPFQFKEERPELSGKTIQYMIGTIQREARKPRLSALPNVLRHIICKFEDRTTLGRMSQVSQQAKKDVGDQLRLNPKANKYTEAYIKNCSEIDKIFKYSSLHVCD